MDLTAIKNQFSVAGFNLVSSLPVTSLQAQEQQQLKVKNPNFSQGCLLLIGSGGRALWQASAEWRANNTLIQDPVNSYSLEVADRILTTAAIGYTSLYPSTEYNVGLINCGKQVGWHGESDLGLGMNPAFGLWWAYRLLIWIDQPIEIDGTMDVVDVCQSCEDKPCLSACPVSALHKTGMDKWQTCSGHRLSEGSSCEDRCFSRLACPVASEHRYIEPQMQYHYRASLVTIRKWYQDANNEAL